MRNREAEIDCQVTFFKEKKENLYGEIGKLKISDFLHNQNNKSETKAITSKEEIKCNVGSKWLRIAEFLYSVKTYSEVFLPIVGDWREEYINALRKGRVFHAVWISIRNYFDFAYSMVICSRFGKSIEFVMKLADVIELFNKFSK
ncbi:MAG: hypothetical protein M3388_14710 [Acidobacteriota bacterium]|nr:hypothetical protein [Acidobacteriota bacterium]